MTESALAKDRDLPDRQSITRAPFIWRSPGIDVRLPTDPTGLSAQQWRAVIARAPIVRSAIQTLIMQIAAIPWAISGDDPDLALYYTETLEHANGEDFITFLKRVLQDTMEAPFGGAFEVVRYDDGALAGLYHVDAGTLAPTYDEKLPYLQQVGRERTFFTDQELCRVMWTPRTDIENYGWTITPVRDCFNAVMALIRADVFWNTLLTDTPPPGVLDLLDMPREEALQWAESARELYAGIDRFKIPVLYDHSNAAQWISFGRNPADINIEELMRRYTEMVTSAFGMSTSDLGMYETTQRFAGTAAVIQLSKRQGLGALMQAIANVLNGRVLPNEVNFAWEPVDQQDRVMRRQAEKLRIDGLVALAGAGVMTTDEVRQTLVTDGIVLIDQFDDPYAAIVDQFGGDAVSGDDPTSEEDAPEAAPGSSSDGAEELSRSRSILEHTCDACGTVHEGICERAGDLGKFLLVDRKIYERMVDVLTPHMERIARAERGKAAINSYVNSIWAMFPGPEPRARYTYVPNNEGGIGRTRASVSRAGLQNRPNAFVALDTLLSQDDWYKVADDELIAKVSNIIGMARQEGLIKAARTFGSAKNEPYNLKSLFPSTITDEGMLQQIKDHAAEMVTRVDQGTKAMLHDTIWRAVRDGKKTYGNKDSVQSAIYDAMGGRFNKARSRSIALTECNRAASEATLEQYKTMGIKRKRWIAVPTVACPVCLQNQGMGPIPVDATFNSVFGPISTPPAHPRICVLPGTMVRLLDGSEAPIETLQVGQSVFASHVRSKRTRSGYTPMGASIEKVKETPHNGEVVEVELEDGRVLKCLGTHEVFTYAGWKRAEALTDQDNVVVYPNLTCIQCGATLATHNMFCDQACHHAWAKGKSYEALYGEHQALDMREMQAATKGRTYAERFGDRADDVRRAVGAASKGRIPTAETNARRGASIHAAYVEGRAKPVVRSGAANAAFGKTWDEHMGVDKAKALRADLARRNSTGVMRNAACLRHEGPSNLEQMIVDLNVPGLWYCGNGHYWVRLGDKKLKVPDFKVHGQKKVVEVLGHYWHHVRRDTDGAALTQAYAAAGYECLVLEESELADLNAVQKRLEAFVHAS